MNCVFSMQTIVEKSVNACGYTHSDRDKNEINVGGLNDWVDACGCVTLR